MFMLIFVRIILVAVAVDAAKVTIMIIKARGLTHWSQDKMAAVLHTTFIKFVLLHDFFSKFHWNFVPKGPNWQYSNIGTDNGLANRQQAIIWINDGL